jgi:hypothetical protein
MLKLLACPPAIGVQRRQRVPDAVGVAAHKRMSGRQGVPSSLNPRGRAQAGPPSLGPAECGNAVSLTHLAGDDIPRGPSMPWGTG